MLSIILLLCVSNLWHLVNVHFGDIPHTSIPHFTLHSAKKSAKNFPQITPWQLSAFRKIPLHHTGSQRRPQTPVLPLRAKWHRHMSVLWLIPLLITVQYIMYFLLVLSMTSCFHMIGHKQIYTSLFTKQVAKNNKEKNNKRNKYSNLINNDNLTTRT